MGVIDLNSQELIAGMASGIKSHKIDEENKMVTFNFNNGTSVAMQVNTSKAKIERVLAAFMENDTTLVKAIEFNSKAESYLKDDIASEKGIVASREYVKNYDISDKLNAYLPEYLADNETIIKVEDSIIRYNYYIDVPKTSSVNIISDIIGGKMILNGMPEKNANVSFEKVLLKAGTYIMQLEATNGKLYWHDTTTGNNSLTSEMKIVTDPKLIVTDKASGTKTTYTIGNGDIVKITNAKLYCEFTLTSDSYVNVSMYLSNTYYYEEFSINAIITEKDIFEDGIYDKLYCLSNNVNVGNSKKKVNTLYFSTTGDDRNDGLTPQTPKKNPMNHCLTGGNTILLKAGDVFDLEGISIGSNTTINTYGGGGYATISGIRTSKNTFELFDSDNRIYSLQFDYNANPSFIMFDNSIKLWSRKLTNNLSTNNEWYFDVSNCVLYIKSDIDIIGKTIRYADGSDGICISNCNNVTIKNIEVYGFAYHGISIGINVDNIHISNNYIHHIGGGLQSVESNVKYGNGIQTWMINESNIYIENNIVTDCFDAGITPQINATATGLTKNTENIYILNNEIRRCAYPIEYFNSQTNTYSAKNIVFADNYLYDCVDITNGYRETSGTGQMALMCLWKTLGVDDSVYLINNIGIRSALSAISFSGGAKEKYHFTNNIFLLESESFVKNEEYYSGNDTFIIVSNTPTTSDDMSKLAYYIALGNEKIKMLPSHEYDLSI